MSKSRDEGQVVEMGGPESNQERYHRYEKCLGKGAFKTVYERGVTLKPGRLPHQQGLCEARLG